MDLLTSVKGIGVTLAAALIMATGGFTYFDNAKQLTDIWIVATSAVLPVNSKVTLTATETLL